MLGLRTESAAGDPPFGGTALPHPAVTPGGLGLSLPISERRVLLVGTDILALSGVAVAVTLQAQSHLVAQLTLIVLLIWLPAALTTGLYDLNTAARVRPALTAITWTAAFFAIALAAASLVLPLGMSRPRYLAMVLLAPGAVALWRLGYTKVLGAAHFERRVVVAGLGPACQAVIEAIQSHTGHGIRILGIVDDAALLDAPDLTPEMPLLCGYAALPAFAAKWRVEEVVVSTDDFESASLIDALSTCCELGVAVTFMPSFYEEVTGQVPVEYIEPHWLSFTPMAPRSGAMGASVKRMLDVVVAGTALILCAPLMLLLAVLVRLTSPGPALYRQVRVGYRGERFEIVKFRTMYQQAELPGQAIWAVPNDGRVTIVGKWMRRTHLDELPQLLLVLVGLMSLVGPRPERPEFVATLEATLPFYRVRYGVRPGLTGWAQVRYPYAASADDALAKLRYDLYYVKKRSVLLDLRILAHTVMRVLRMRGR